MNRGLFSIHIFAFLFISILLFVSGASASEVEHVEQSQKDNVTSEFEETFKDGEVQTNANDNLEPSLDVESTGNKEIFTETTLQNSVNEIINNDTPIIVPLSDTATAELQQRANISSIVSSESEENKKSSPVETQVLNKSQEAKVEIRIEKNASGEESVEKVVIEVPIAPKNLTDANQDIPSFSEWAQKRLEEAEKNEQVNASSQSQNVTSKHHSGGKLRWKNYASLDCGAKVVLSNPEAVSPSAILSPSMDEYKLNTCTSRIWFIVELCEAIHVTRIEIANFELFSSSPKDFTVSVSDRFPTRDWQFAGHFTAKDERDVQRFDVDPQIFGKFIKVEIKSYYGSEHYCPISLFRAYGTSVFEVLQKDDPANVNQHEDDNDDDDDVLSQSLNSDGSKNIFTHATDAVINIVKKAAEVLGNKVNGTDFKLQNRTLVENDKKIVCATPSHNVVCKNCSDTLFGQLYELLSCQFEYIKNLVKIPFIRNKLIESEVCRSFGVIFNDRNDLKSSYVEQFFPIKYLGAMCNTISIILDQATLNMSQQYSNMSEKILPSNIIDIPEIESQKVGPLPITKDESEVKATEPLENESKIVTTSYSTDISYTSQIQPTKTLVTSPDIKFNTYSTDIVDDKKEPEDSGSVSTNSDTFENVEQNDTLENATNIENNTEIIDSVTESIEAIEENLENFISELNNNTEYVNNNNVSSTAQNNNQQTQKESVFMRLSNRIKTLERNMSLSSQYLEELSKRYKKQVEEMQRLFEQTILVLREESKSKEERNRQLEEHLAILSSKVDTLMAERYIAYSILYWICLSGVIVFIFRVFRGRFGAKTKFNEETQRIGVGRRKSIDVIMHSTPKKKKRRPSDQALKIVTSATEKNLNSRDKQKKRKKKISLVRSNSIDISVDGSPQKNNESCKDFVEDSRVEDVPFALEESDNSVLEVLPVGNEIKIDVPDYARTATNSRLSRYRNGSSFSSITKRFNLKERNTKPNSSNVSSNGSISSYDTDQSGVKEKGRFKKFFKRLKSTQTNGG